MDIKKLMESVPEAQARVLEHIAHDSEVLQVDEQNVELQNRLNAVNTSFASLAQEFGMGDGGLKVTLSIHTATYNEETGEEVRPAGAVEVIIERLSKADISGSNDPSLAGHHLSFYFVPLIKGNALNAFRESIGDESTFWPSTEDSRYDRAGVGSLGSSHFTDSGVLNLRNHADVYLPERTRQIQDVEDSLAVIKLAIENPELNPWVQERRLRNADILQQKLDERRQWQEETAALAGERLRQAREAASVAAVAETPRRRFFRKAL